MKKIEIPPGFQEMMSFPLIEALLGRRSRVFLSELNSQMEFLNTDQPIKFSP